MEDEVNVPMARAIMIDHRQFAIDTPTITGAVAAELAGLSPADAYVLVRVDEGRASLVVPDEEIEIAGAVPVLRSGRAVSPWRLYVDGQQWDWATPGILETDVREIAGLLDADAIYEEGQGVPVRTGGLIDLTAVPPRLTSRAPRAPTVPAKVRSVPVVINGRPRELADPDVTFEDLVKLAFPQLPALAGKTFTVTYRRGGAAQPDGSLVPQQAARLAPGAVINVSATTKS